MRRGPGRVSASGWPSRARLPRRITAAWIFDLRRAGRSSSWNCRQSSFRPRELHFMTPSQAGDSQKVSDSLRDQRASDWRLGKVAQTIEGTQASRQQQAKSGSEAQSDQRTRQGGEQQSARSLQRRSPGLPFGPLGFGGLSPFSLMRRVLEDMDRMFEGLGSARPGLEGSTTGGFPPIWSPAIDVVEREGRFVVRADVPGLSPDDIRLEIRDGTLGSEGERRQEIEVEGKEGVYRSERMYGRFSRRL